MSERASSRGSRKRGATVAWPKWATVGLVALIAIAAIALVVPRVVDAFGDKQEQPESQRVTAQVIGEDNSGVLYGSVDKWQVEVPGIGMVSLSLPELTQSGDEVIIDILPGQGDKEYTLRVVEVVGLDARKNAVEKRQRSADQALEEWQAYHSEFAEGAKVEVLMFSTKFMRAYEPPEWRADEWRDSAAGGYVGPPVAEAVSKDGHVFAALYGPEQHDAIENREVAWGKEPRRWTLVRREQRWWVEEYLKILDQAEIAYIDSELDKIENPKQGWGYDFPEDDGDEYFVTDPAQQQLWNDAATEGEQGAGASGGEATQVKVPDVFAALAAHQFSATQEEGGMAALYDESVRVVKDTLAKSGLRVRIVDVTADSQGTQNPAAGEVISKGEAVTVKLPVPGWYGD